MEPSIKFTTDRSEINIDFVTNYLAIESYWAKGRTQAKIVSTINNSFCIGMFLGSDQVGFGRVVTDYETFAYIMDVFVSPDHQNKGYGKKLMRALLKSRELANLNKIHLKTVGAESFYMNMGFSKVQQDFFCLELN